MAARPDERPLSSGTRIVVNCADAMSTPNDNVRVTVFNTDNPTGSEQHIQRDNLRIHYDFHDVHHESDNGNLQGCINNAAYLVVNIELRSLLWTCPYLELKSLRRLCYVHRLVYNHKSKRQLNEMLSKHQCVPSCGSVHIVVFKARLFPRAQQLAGMHRWISYAPPGQPSLMVDSQRVQDSHPSQDILSDALTPGEIGRYDTFRVQLQRPQALSREHPATQTRDGSAGSSTPLTATVVQPSRSELESVSSRPVVDQIQNGCSDPLTSQSHQTDHLDILTADEKLEILTEWEHAMSTASLTLGVCACCSGNRTLVDMKWVDSRKIDLELLTNPELGQIHLPTNYALDVYHNAILDARGMERTHELGRLLLCGSCHRTLSDNRMPRFALANHLYFAREQLPAPVRVAFEESSLFERRLICRGRYNTISCRYTGTGYHAGTAEPTQSAPPNHSIVSELSRARRGVKGNIMVVPTDSIRLHQVIPPPSNVIKDTMCVVFVGAEKPTLESITPRHKAPVLVRRTRVKTMIDFLLQYNRCYTPGADFAFSQSNLDLLLPADQDEGLMPTVEVGHLERSESLDASSADYTPRGDALSDPTEDSELVFENVGYTEGDTGPSSYHAMKYLAMERCRRGLPFVLSGTGNTPVPDFNNPNLLSWLFPHLDPWGIAGFLHPHRRIKISMEQQLCHMLTSADRLFEQDEQFAFVFYNIIRKIQVANSVRFSVSPTVHRQLTTAILDINPDTLADMAAKFKADSCYVPATEEEKRVHRVMSSVTLVSHHVPGSNGHKLVLRNEIRALINHQGTPTLFLTLNPADVDSPVVRLMAGQDVDLDSVTGDESFDSWRRRLFAAKHPAACAIYFDTVIKQFIRVGLKFDPVRRKIGIFGRCTAYYGTVEAQGKGTLHCHMLVWLEGHLPPHQLRAAMLGSTVYRDKVIQWVESVIKCEFPTPTSMGSVSSMNRMAVQPPVRIRHYSLGNPHPGTTQSPSIAIAKQASPDVFWAEFNQFVTQLLHEYHWHEHNMSCWKYLRKGERMSDENCRLRMDGTTKIDTTVHPETGELSLRRHHPWIAAYNELVTFMLKSNSELKFIGSGKAARDLVYYITDYVTKPSLPVHAGMAALQYALQKIGRVVQSSPEGRTHTVNASSIVAAVNSMMGRQEISHPQVMSYLIGGGDHYTSHRYCILTFGALLSYVEMELKIHSATRGTEPPDTYPRREGPDISYSLDVRKDSVTTSNQQQDYVYRNRDAFFDGLCVYDFVSLVRKESIPKSVLKSNNDISSIKGSFDSEHQQCATHRLVGRQTPHVPVLLGPSIPNPKRSAEAKELWAKYIVLLFIPWRRPIELKAQYASWLEVYEARERELSACHRRVIDNMNAFSESTDERALAPLSRKRPRDIGDDISSERVHIPFAHSQEVEDDYDCSNENHTTAAEIANPFLSFQESETYEGSLDGYISRRIGPEIVPILDRCYDAPMAAVNTIQGTGLVPNSCVTELTVAMLPRVAEYQTFMRGARQKRTRDVEMHDDTSLTVPNSNDALSFDDLQGRIVPRTQISSIVEGTDSSSGALRRIGHLDPSNAVEKIIEDMNLHSNPEQLKAFKAVSDHVVHQNPSQLLMYVSGVGGTGKSHVIKAIVSLFKALHCERELLLGAPTGIAAVLIGGQTLHSLAFINSSGRTGRNPALASTWRHVRYLIIDEVSMIGAKFLSMFSNRIREAKIGDSEDVSRPFGGINVIFMGDFGQLKPPVQYSLYAHAVTRNPSFKTASSVDGISASNGIILWRQVSIVIELRKNQRHTSDPDYSAFLMRLRAGVCRPLSPSYPWDDWSYLRSRLLTNLTEEDLLQFKDAPIIVGSKSTRDALNAKLIAYNAAQVGEDVHLYHSIDSVKKVVVPLSKRGMLWNLDSSMTQEAFGRLPLFTGMKVMITENIAFASGIVNGSEGVVTSISYNTDSSGIRTAAVVYVKINGCGVHLPGLEQDVVPIFPVSNTINYSFYLNGETSTKSFSRKQVPLVPAYAYTDFKSQGRTLDFAFVDIATARGQGVYVMLSRVKSLKGIAILRWFHPSKIYSRLAEELRDEMDRISQLVEISNRALTDTLIV